MFKISKSCVALGRLWSRVSTVGGKAPNAMWPLPQLYS